MKKTIFLILMAILFTSLSLSGLSLAQDMKNKGTPPDMKPGAPSMGPMENMMVMQIMKDKSVMATPDGGIAVVVANKLIKYDKDLNVTKESDVDAEIMQQSMMARMMPQPPMMMPDMRDRTVIATTDGGIVLAAGNKLVKYDKDFNAVKKAEIKIDLEAVRQNMMSMTAGNPMMRHGMMNMGKAPVNAENSKGAAGAKK